METIRWWLAGGKPPAWLARLPLWLLVLLIAAGLAVLFAGVLFLTWPAFQGCGR